MNQGQSGTVREGDIVPASADGDGVSEIMSSMALRDQLSRLFDSLCAALADTPKQLTAI